MNLKIVTTNASATSATVYIDGEVATNVTRVELDLDAGHLTTARLTYITSVDVSVEVDPDELTSA